MKVSTHTAMLALVVAACLFITTYASIIEQPPLSEKEYQTLFVEFLNRYDKKYEVSDFFSRYSIFRENLDWIRAFNADPSNTHTVEANIFADLKPSEWKQYMGLKFPQNWQEPDYELLENKDWSEIGHLKEVYSKYQDAPNAVDWVAANDVTPIRNQGSCGSCFSFSSVGAIESLSLINNKTAQDEHFSVQDALDCTRGSPYYCQGCGGGFPSSVMAWVHDNQGICKDADYPYEGRAGSCRSTKCENVFSIDGYVGVSGYSEKTMARAAAINPLSIAITADTREFMYYKSGIINYCSVYSYQQPDHAVIIVGYNLETNTDNNDGKSASVPYWVIRNSWGKNWGEDGYVRFRFGGNVCKIRSNVHYPILKTSEAAFPLLEQHNSQQKEQA